LSLNQTSSMVCTVCQKQKHQLRPRKSKLNSNMQMFLCNDCFSGKYEPRWLIILVGQSFGPQAIEEYLVSHRYAGVEIPAVDLIK
jgi:hypothetical protein